MAKKKGSRLAKSSKVSSDSLSSASGGKPVDMVLIPSGFTWVPADSAESRRTAEDATLLQRSGMAVPVFTLVPSASIHGGEPAGERPASDKRSTRSYGGHDLLVSGSMCAVQGPPSFTLTPPVKPSKPGR